MLFFFFPPAVSSRRQEVKAKCSLTCEYLTEEDYTDLLWTTLSEFPGKEQGAAAVFPWNGPGCGNGLWQQQWNWDVWPEPSHSTSELLSVAVDPSCPGITPEEINPCSGMALLSVPTQQHFRRRKTNSKGQKPWNFYPEVTSQKYFQRMMGTVNPWRTCSLNLCVLWFLGNSSKFQWTIWHRISKIVWNSHWSSISQC